MPDTTFDVIVIGAGPAGYPCAIRAAQNKLKVACIDEWKNLDGSYAFGGTCLNAGCIPSKALLESSELYHRAQSSSPRTASRRAGSRSTSAPMQKRKAQIVKASDAGHRRRCSRRRASRRCRATASCSPATASSTRRRRQQARTRREARGARLRVRCRSSSSRVPFDGKDIVDSWGALEFDAVPKRLGVIGAGVIGLELGSVWRRLGAEVVVLEALEQFLFMADQQLAKEALQALQEAGPRHPPRREGRRARAWQGRRHAQVHRRLGCEDGRRRQGRRRDRPPAVHRRTCSATAPASNSTSAASSRSTTSAAPAPATSGPSATSCAGRCWRTRARKRA